MKHNMGLSLLRILNFLFIDECFDIFVVHTNLSLLTMLQSSKVLCTAYYNMYMHIDYVYVLMMFLFCLILKNGQCCNLLQAELEELIILTVLDLMLLCIVLIDKDSLHSHLDTFYSKQLFLHELLKYCFSTKAI